MTTQADELQGIAAFFKIEGSNVNNYGPGKTTSNAIIKKDLSANHKLKSVNKFKNGNSDEDGKSAGIEINMSSREDEHFEQY